MAHNQFCRSLASLTTILFAFAHLSCAQPPDPVGDRHVGPTADSATIAPNAQLIRPAGQTLTYPGRPFDLALCPGRPFLLVKDAKDILVVDVANRRIAQTLPFIKEAGSMHGIVAVPGDAGSTRVYVSGAHDSLLEATLDADAKLRWSRRIALPAPGGKEIHPKDAHPLGIALTRDGATAYVCLSKNNSLAVVDLQAGTVAAQIPVGVCPYSVVLGPDGTTAYVTNFGGHPPAAKEPAADSAGTKVAVDRRGIPLSGTVSKVDLTQRKAIGEIAVGLHPCQAILTRDGSRLFVANANSDSISVIDTAADRVVETIDVRPDSNLPFGSIPNALALSPDEKTLYCANGGNNALAVITPGNTGAPSRVEGFIPTGWFPGGVVCDGNNVFVANVKGEGSRDIDPKKNAWNSRRYLGSVTIAPLPDGAGLKELTEQMRVDSRVPQALLAMERARPDRPPLPIPQRAGEPGVFRHVVYVLKENRTYDQMLGDIPAGNGDPRLCIYGNTISPNHHALAAQFALLDNYYCNGVVSADGHQWATQGMVTDYQEKDFGDFTRSYDFGTDALCYAACDFLWDTALLHGLTFRNYGEFDFPKLADDSQTWFDVNRQWKKTGTVNFTQSIDLAPLKPYTATDYPGWLLRIPDGYRIERFLKEFKAYEKAGDLPNLLIVYLPQDHTAGTGATVPSPQAFVADNDLALGRLVEAISHSRFWKDTCIFVNEDDPQDGFDHVDGHRSICLVASAYTKRGAVVSRFYNQTSVLHTMCRMLGLPPMNQMVALAPTMEDCFNLAPDPRPYDCMPANIALDEPNKSPAKSADAGISPEAAAKMDFSRPDLNDDDLFNRLLWSAARPSEKYPAEWAGAHGKGLKKLKLKLQEEKGDDDDD
ncbi:MAG TPA: bifunctional YncE family protein/alkaline phosphatase family protein [Tepidisphaeraceae bacterium]|nr:bifunctional YncE family protein/alkaline phosphatase family protein [Tepidisphaeraceae bacterium]